MAKVIRYRGNAPEGDHWFLEREVTSPRGVEWAVWCELRSKPKGYVNFKVVAKSEPQRKANFWLTQGPNGPTKKKDVKSLEENFPWLALRVKEIMAEVYEREMSRPGDALGNPTEGQSALV